MHCRPKINSFRSFVGIVTALSLCCLAGCIEKTTNGAETVYSYSQWPGLPIALMALLPIPVAMFCLDVDPRMILICIILGSLFLVFSSPVYTDTVLVDDEHFVASYGLFFDPVVQDIRFDELAEMKYVWEGSSSRSVTRYKLYCTMKSGQGYIVHGHDILGNAIPEILAKARAKGVPVLDQARMRRGM